MTLKNNIETRWVQFEFIRVFRTLASRARDVSSILGRVKQITYKEIGTCCLLVSPSAFFRIGVNNLARYCQ